MKVREGDVVGPRAPLAEIIDPASMLVRVAVPEEEAARLTLGMPARVALDAWPQQTLRGARDAAVSDAGRAHALAPGRADAGGPAAAAAGHVRPRAGGARDAA
ncbi:MAG: HlyD family secretion protein [Desulfosudis oleivorans]|nr:HlyD family secretion protein [Desulfosudis oleivorans]